MKKLIICLLLFCSSCNSDNKNQNYNSNFNNKNSNNIILNQNNNTNILNNNINNSTDCSIEDNKNKYKCSFDAKDCLKDTNCKFPIIVAHRGICSYEPENTLIAVQKCSEKLVPMVEIDVRETKDGVIVIMHDSTVDRTTDGKTRFPNKIEVTNLTYDEFKQLVIDDEKCEDINDENFNIRCHPPGFSELLSKASPEMMYFIDYKSGTVSKIIEELKNNDAVSRSIFFTNKIEALKEVHSLEPELILLPRAYSAEETLNIVNEYKNELNLSWIHIEPGFLNELTGHEDLNDIRLYLDTFTIIDTYLGASEYSDDPEPLLLEAKTRFDQILKDGAMGMGSNYGTYMIQYLLTDY